MVRLASGLLAVASLAAGLGAPAGAQERRSVIKGTVVVTSA